VTDSFCRILQSPKQEVCFKQCIAPFTQGGEYLAQIVFSLDLSSDIEFAVTVCCGCAVLRIFDMGRYVFAFPYELTDNADIEAALDAVAEYAMREELPLVFTDVPPESFGLFSGYRHMDFDAEDSECSSYRVRVKNECEMVHEIPDITVGRVKLNCLTEADIPAFAELSKDQNVNKYWGYDYRDDVMDPDDGYFFENAEREFASGVAMSMAVRVDGEFCGESTLYAFDGKGSAEFAIRLLKSKQGIGIGTDGVLATMAAARNIGLVRLRAFVMRENAASFAMLKKVGGRIVADGEKTEFVIDL